MFKMEGRQTGEPTPSNSETFNQSRSYSIDSQDQIFLDITEVAPAPSRDFFRLLVTQEWVRLTHWKITHGARGRDQIEPTERFSELGKFSKNHVLTSEILRVFGQNNFDYITGISEGRYDWILSLPDSNLVKIFSLVGIQSLANISPVCKRFKQICESDSLWKIWYHNHSGVKENTETIRTQSKHFSWKNLYLVNRIQDKIFPGNHYILGIPRMRKGLENDLKNIKLVGPNKPRRPAPNLRPRTSRNPEGMSKASMEQLQQSRKIEEYFKKVGGIPSHMFITDAFESASTKEKRSQQNLFPVSGDGPSEIGNAIGVNRNMRHSDVHGRRHKHRHTGDLALERKTEK